MVFTTDVPDSVLIQRLLQMNSFISLPYNETVKNYMILYSEKMPRKMGELLGLSEYYMPIFEETFRRYDLPLELKYVAIIESALNPRAQSRVGATGMWQFMYRTALNYGLRIDSYVDERMDPVASADAAARYFRDAYRIFGDWALAISSYNCGSGNVNKAIKRAGGRRDFWSIYDYLPRETRGYVPAMVGAMYAFRYAKEYGLSPEPVPVPTYVDTFHIHRNLHLGQVSEMLGLQLQFRLPGCPGQHLRVPGGSFLRFRRPGRPGSGTGPSRPHFQQRQRPVDLLQGQIRRQPGQDRQEIPHHRQAAQELEQLEERPDLRRPAAQSGQALVIRLQLQMQRIGRHASHAQLAGCPQPGLQPEASQANFPAAKG